MNWRRILYHLALTLGGGGGGTVAGGFIGNLSTQHLDPCDSGVASTILFSLMLGGIIGLLVGFCGAFFLSDDRLRKTSLAVFLIDVIVIVVLALTDYLY